jgi:short-chain Z-isoprenyl diphosphate synthase
LIAAVTLQSTGFMAGLSRSQRCRSIPPTAGVQLADDPIEHLGVLMEAPSDLADTVPLGYGQLTSPLDQIASVAGARAGTNFNHIPKRHRQHTMNHLNSRYNLDHFGTSPPTSEIERPRPLAGGLPQNDETESRAVGKALQRLLLRPLYQLYEIGLQRQVCIQPPPRHVGIILDGNRRYARKYGATDPHQIYALGARKLDDVLEWCCELRIPAVTLWAVSTDNLSRRSAAEVSGILAAVEAKLAALAQDPRIHQQRVRVKAVGRLELLPAPTVAAIRAAEEATATYDDGLALTIAIAYGGHDEITDAVRTLLRAAANEGKALTEAIEAVTPAAIARHLYMAGLPDPDLIIRTSGESRLSGFLLWQSAYSELHFTDVNWPAFRKIDFLRAIRAFQQRKRRFGG